MHSNLSTSQLLHSRHVLSDHYAHNRGTSRNSFCTPSAPSVMLTVAVLYVDLSHVREEIFPQVRCILELVDKSINKRVCVGIV